jgi:hypothetical protein
VTTRITSDPPLTSTQIANLLATGDENNTSSATGAAGMGVVSSVLDDAAGRVAQELGIGLSRLSINAPLGGHMGTRLTVGKRVSNDLEVVYSGYVAGSTDKLVTVEYTLSNRFSLVGSWQEPGGFGADARARFVLGKKK